MRALSKRIYSLLTHEYFLFCIVFAISIGTYYARAAVSIATVTLGIIGLFTVLQQEKRKELLQHRSILALTVVFGVVLLSGLISTNSEMWQSRLITNIPFLAIPIGVWAFGPLKTKTIVGLVMVFVGVTAISGLVMMIDYIGHFAEYNDLYKVGKTIPTPIIHVRYSYFLALAAICCAGILMDKFELTKQSKWLVMVAGVFLLICVHVLAVRTGLLALYGGIIVLTILVIVREGKWRQGLLAISIIVILALVSVKLLPSVYNKMSYVLYDLKMLTEQVSPEYSDNVRLTSIKHGLKVFSDNPFFGVGAGDIDDVMIARYEAETPSVPLDKRFPPISQYVFWLATYGLVGTLFILWLLGYPLIQKGRTSYLLWGIYALTAFSFFAETTIQLQLGKTMFLLIVTIVLQWHVLRGENALTVEKSVTT